MKTFVKPGHEINFVATADAAGGEVIVKGALVGVNAYTLLSGAVGVMEISGVHKLPKTAALAIDQGDLLYYDAATKRVNKTNTGVFIGYAEDSELAASATVRVLLGRPGAGA